MKPLTVAGVISSCIGVAAGLACLLMGLRNNNQGEFYDTVTGVPVWDSVVLLFGIPTLCVGVVVFLLLLPVAVAIRPPE